MLTSKMIKEAALAAGADKCGIAPMSRFKGAPDEIRAIAQKTNLYFCFLIAS